MQFKKGVNSYYDEWVKTEKLIEHYKGVDIFEYSDMLGNPQFTYWYGEGCGDYMSSIKSIEEAKEWIDRKN